MYPMLLEQFLASSQTLFISDSVFVLDFSVSLFNVDVLIVVSVMLDETLEVLENKQVSVCKIVLEVKGGGGGGCGLDVGVELK